MTVYPGPVPTGQQRLQAFMTTSSPYLSPGFLPGQQRQPLYQQTTPSPGWNSWVGAGWDQQLLAHSFNTMAFHPPPTSVQDWVADFGVTHHTTLSVGNISTPRPLNSSNPSSIIVGNGYSLPVTSVWDSVFDEDSFPLAASPSLTNLDFFYESSSTVFTIWTNLTTVGTSTPAAHQTAPEIPLGFEPLCLPYPPRQFL
jgi:hypothetical protein